MIDHALGRPDPRYRKYQIVAVLALWSAYIYAKPHGPKPISKLSRFFGRRVTIWQCVVLTCLTEYVRRNFKRMIPWLEAPEPLANMYSRDYFRATWVTTALDAGFWTAMRIRPRWAREVASILFTAYYLVCAEQADEMVRKVRGKLSLEHLRVSWNKPASPILSWVTSHLRPARLRMRYRPRRVRIPRPPESPYKEPIHAVLYFDGPVDDLKNQDKVILDIPGGGFVAMDPRCHDDKLMAWARKTGFPVLALDYKKAPEHPYPYALNECFDAYHSIVASRGRLIGLPGDCVPKIILSGDSAGGNLACGVVLMILQARSGTSDYFDRQRHATSLPLPEAVVLVYPALDVNMTSWLTDDQSALIKDPTRRKVNEGVVRRKTEEYHSIANIPLPDEEERDEGLHMSSLRRTKSKSAMKDSLLDGPSMDDGCDEHGVESAQDPEVLHFDFATKHIPVAKPRPLRTRLEMTSMISYVDDRILSPELLRAMIILYLGEYKRPDFSTEFLLSPLRAPEELLRQFPKVYMLTGERDPLSDDTALFAGRLLESHLHRFESLKEAGYIASSEEFKDDDYVHYELIPGVSHGFLQFASVYSKGYELIELCSRWMKEAFHNGDKDSDHMHRQHGMNGYPFRRSSSWEEAVDNEDQPLEMSSRPLQSSSSIRRLSGSSTGVDRRDASGRGRIKKPAFSGRRSPVLSRRENVSLNMTTLVEQALLHRRMDEVVRGLSGDDDRPKTPT